MGKVGLRDSQAPVSGGRTPPISEPFLKKQMTIVSTPYNILFLLYMALTQKSMCYLTRKVKDVHTNAARDAKMLI